MCLIQVMVLRQVLCWAAQGLSVWQVGQKCVRVLVVAKLMLTYPEAS